MPQGILNHLLGTRDIDLQSALAWNEHDMGVTRLEIRVRLRFVYVIGDLALQVSSEFVLIHVEEHRHGVARVHGEAVNELANKTAAPSYRLRLFDRAVHVVRETDLAGLRLPRRP